MSAQTDTLVGVGEAIQRGVQHLSSMQDPHGWWKGHLRTNVTMDAEDLLLREFLDIRTGEETDQAARWIRAQQRDDGTWATFQDGPGDLSTTVEAYVVLKLAGDDIDAAHMASARRFIRSEGGVERTRVFTRIWLALFGEWSWDDLPAMPPELIFFPHQAPLNIYDWACWARQTVVPLTIVCTLRPQRPFPFELSELRTGAPALPKSAPTTMPGLFERLDQAMHLYEKLPVKPLRQNALRKAAEWIVARQESDGGWGGIQPPWVYSILALHLLGYPLDHPVLKAAIDGLEGFLVHEQSSDGPVRWLEACQSPVWDTALTMIALSDAGVPGDHPSMQTAGQWIVDEEIRVQGDWSVRRPEVAPSGWAFEFANDTYPDIDDTAEVLLALRRLPVARTPDIEGAMQRGTEWILGMQSKDGGWAAFDADNTDTIPEQLPFCDFGAVIDPPSADVTAHVVEWLAARGLGDHPATRRGIRWLLANQDPDGSWFGRWGANHVYGTGAVVPALIAVGMGRDDLPIRRAVRWLEGHQNEDGGWGEDLRSYDDAAYRGRGTTTPSQTAWALLALLAAGERSTAVDRGIGWLTDHQRADGGWDEDQYTGTGFPGDFYISYELYRDIFPLNALGRYARGVAVP